MGEKAKVEKLAKIAGVFAVGCLTVAAGVVTQSVEAALTTIVSAFVVFCVMYKPKKVAENEPTMEPSSYVNDGWRIHPPKGFRIESVVTQKGHLSFKLVKE